MAQFCSICGKSARETAMFCQACGAPFVQVLQAGSILDRGRYEVKSALKSGGMGAVYLLWDLRLERDCALKERISLSYDPAEMKKFRERFRNEALTLSKLSHPNLPRIQGHFEENHHCYLVMEYVDGDDLESLLAASPSKNFPEEKVLQWALTICAILEYLHSRNPLILYRDLKPSNIMLRRDDERLFLIDFGIAKRVQSALTHRISWGTEGYTPIEQCQGEPEVRSDLYALGATMHYLLSGRPPVPFKFPAIRSLRPEVSAEMEAVLEKALKLHAYERYHTAREMREALEGVGQSAKATHPVAAPLPQSSPSVVQPNAAPSIPTPPASSHYKSIFEAVENNDLMAVKDFISSGTDVNIQQSDWDRTPLHCAAEKGYRDIVEYLIAKGANINAAGRWDYTPLHDAIYKGQIEVAKVLVSKGANVNAVNDMGDTPLHFAADHGHKEVVELLVSKGADVEAISEAHYTMLHCAAAGGLRDFAEFLILNGADIQATIEFGYTPLHYAARHGHKEIAELLISKGADVDVTLEDCRTPLHLAAYNGQKEVAELLIEKGADVNATDKYTKTPLHKASYGGHMDFAELLLAKGADVNAKDKDGRTPLHDFLLSRRRTKMAKLLISKGADVNAADKDGKTPRDLTDDNTIIELLEQSEEEYEDDEEGE